MSISGTDQPARAAAKTALVYVRLSLFVALFGAVYELFSHEVYSFYMIYAFVFPLAGGVLPFLMMAVLQIKRYPDVWFRNLYHSGIATLTAGSIVRGVLEIYGTTNSLTRFYWWAGAILITAAILASLLREEPHEW